MDSKGQSLTFPETPNWETSAEQIITSKVKVQYLGSAGTQCSLVSKTLWNEMDNIIYSFEKK